MSNFKQTFCLNSIPSSVVVNVQHCYTGDLDHFLDRVEIMLGSVSVNQSHHTKVYNW